MRRCLVIVALLSALVGVGRADGGKPEPAGRSWAHAEIRLVTARGLLGADPIAFRAEDPLTQGELAELVAGLTATSPAPVSRPDARVTIAGLDARLVHTLGLADAATALQRAVRDAGLAPPQRFSTEALARLLGLRPNHPASRDALEPLPNGPATRAEAAYSAARILRLDATAVEAARATAMTFAPEALEPWQRRVLTTAYSFVGYPYVWGGESERPVPAGPYGPQAQGGFDCSGFVWRVYKLEPYEGAEALATTLRGRTTYELSGEATRAQRIPFAKVAPGDVLFFGADGRRSRPAQVDHAGIYAGGGWMIHSSGNGVTLAPVAGWYARRFAWARRPLAEAGLVSGRAEKAG